MVLERAELDRLHLPLAEVVEDRRLRLLVHDPVVTRRARRRGSRRGRARRSSRPSSQDLLEDRGGALALARASGRARSGRSPRRPRPGTSPARRRRRGAGAAPRTASDVSPPGTSTQRYIVASLAATRQPFRASTGRSTSRFRPVGIARALDVRLVAPGDDRRALDELLRRGAGRGPVGLERRDDLRRRRRRTRSGSRSSTSAWRASGRRRRSPGRRARAPSAAAR